MSPRPAVLTVLAACVALTAAVLAGLANLDYVIADSLGALIGTSLSPEMWVAVFVVIRFGQTLLGFIVALLCSAAAIIALRYALHPGDGAIFFVAPAAALLLWSLIGLGVRGVYRRFNRPAPTPAP